MGNDEEGVLSVDPDADRIRIVLELPQGYRFLPDMHHFLNVGSSDESVISVPPFDIGDPSSDLAVPVEVRGEGEALLHLEGQVFFCPVVDGTVCIYATIDEERPVRVVAGSGGEAVLRHRIEVMEELAGARALTATPPAPADEK